MRILVTGSRGHLGEALVRRLKAQNYEVVGLDILSSPFTDYVGSITSLDFVSQCLHGVDVVLHTATLHKPHVGTHSRQAFVDTNISGTLNILEASLEKGVSGVIFTSTTSTFGETLHPEEGQPAVWIDEEAVSVPKNIYGVTKVAAENLCELFYRAKGLPSLVLRTSRFFPEADDNPKSREEYDDLNLKVNEYLHRRVDIADIVEAHILAMQQVTTIGFNRYIISATSPFQPQHLTLLRNDAPQVVRELFPHYEAIYQKRGWKMFPSIDRVYVNGRARAELGWTPRYDFPYLLERIQADEPVFSQLAREIGSKGYHATNFDEGPYPVELRPF